MTEKPEENFYKKINHAVENCFKKTMPDESSLPELANSIVSCLNTDDSTNERFKWPGAINKEAQKEIIFYGLSMAPKIKAINEIIALIKMNGPIEITMAVLNRYFSNH